MKPTIYYTVESNFWRIQIGNKLDYLLNDYNLKNSFHNEKKKFNNVYPIIAREEAFNHYQSIIDVLYDGINKKYINDRQARIELQKYFNSGNDIELLKNSTNKFKISDDIFNGIFIYMIIEEPFNKQKILIHSLNYIDYEDKIDNEIICFIKGLLIEFEYYKKYSLNTKNNTLQINLNEIGGKLNYILKTSFDFEFFIKTNKGLKLM